LFCSSRIICYINLWNINVYTCIVWLEKCPLMHLSNYKSFFESRPWGYCVFSYQNKWRWHSWIKPHIISLRYKACSFIVSCFPMYLSKAFSIRGNMFVHFSADILQHRTLLFWEDWLVCRGVKYSSNCTLFLYFYIMAFRRSYMESTLQKCFRIAYETTVINTRQASNLENYKLRSSSWTNTQALEQ